MGFFDRFYYGKAGKADYTPEDLPANRFQLFREVLRVRLWSLMRLNLLQLIFWLPMILLTLLTLMGLNALAGEIAEGGGALADGMASVLSTYALLLIPCLLITGPSTAAAAHVARNWARDQHAFLWSDFKDAFKDNWKQGLCASAITSVLPLLVVVGVRFYGALAATLPIALVAQALLILTAALWALALVFLYPLMVNYTLNLRGLLRNGVMLALGRLPFAAAIRLATLIPLLLAAFALLSGALWGVLLIGLYYALIGFALHRLIYASFANGVFDRFINPRIEGAPVNLGLRTDDDEDDAP